MPKGGASNYRSSTSKDRKKVKAGTRVSRGVKKGVARAKRRKRP